MDCWIRQDLTIELTTLHQLLFVQIAEQAKTTTAKAIPNQNISISTKSIDNG
jgi:hypothetical protein